MRFREIAPVLTVCILALRPVGDSAQTPDYSICEQVVSNENQLARVFDCDVFSMPTIPPDFRAWLLYPQFLWVNTNQLPGVFGASLEQSSEQIQGVTVLKVRLTRLILTGQTLVEFGTNSVLLLAPVGYSTNLQVWSVKSCLNVWRQWIDWDALDANTIPTLRMDIALANVVDKTARDERVAAEEAAAEAAAAAQTEAAAAKGGIMSSAGFGGMLYGMELCSITDEAAPFAIIQISQDGEGLTTVTWESCSDHLYEVETADELTTQTVWAAQVLLIGEDVSTSWTDEWSPWYAERFYRVRRLAFDGDADSDGLSNYDEYSLGTDMHNPDSDGDGMADGWEVAHGLDPLDDSDADADPDGDGFSNLMEFLNGTDPAQVDVLPEFVVNGGQLFTTSRTITVEAVSTNVDAIRVSLNPTMDPVTVVTNTGTMSYTLPDADAKYDLFLQFATLEGAAHSPVAVRSVTLDRTAPVVVIDSPASNAVIDQAFITLQAEAGDPDPLNVTESRPLEIWINDQPFWNRQGTRVAAARYPVPLGTNSFTVTVLAVDEAGNTNQASRTWTVNPSGDAVAPQLTNFNIAATTLLPDVSTLWLEATVDDGNALVEAIVKSDATEVTTNGLNVRGIQVEGFVPLELGTNTVTVRAFDAAGNTTSNVFTVIRSTRYRFEITSPTFCEFATAPSNYVSGYVSAKFDEGLPTETNVTTVLINGVPAVLDTNVDENGNVTFTTTNAVPIGVPIRGYLAGSGIPTDPPPDPPAPTPEYEVVKKIVVHDLKQTAGETYGAFPVDYEDCHGWLVDAGNELVTNEFIIAGQSATVNVTVGYRGHNYMPCFTDPEDPAIWGEFQDFWDLFTCADTNGVRALSFGSQPRASRMDWEYQDDSCSTEKLISGLWLYRLCSYHGYLDVNWWPWENETRATLTFKAPRQYDTNTTVIFTFEGMDYQRPEGTALDLSKVKFQGRAPIAWSNEIKSVSYLITVDGGREYTLNNDSFRWPSFETNNIVWNGCTTHYREILHHLSWTNFHNQVEPMEVITNTTANTYNGDDWAVVWCKLDLGEGKVSAKNETLFKDPPVKVREYIPQTISTTGSAGIQYGAAINGSFFTTGSGTGCSSIKGYVGTGTWCGNSATGGKRWGFGISAADWQHIVRPDVEDANGYSPSDEVKQKPFGLSNVGALFLNSASVPDPTDPTWPFHDSRRPRSILVWSKDKKNLFMVVIGYQAGPFLSTGPTWNDTIDFLQSKFSEAVAKKLPGFRIGDAIMLDGGQSVQLSFRRVKRSGSSAEVTQLKWVDTDSDTNLIERAVPTLVHTYANAPQ